MAQHALKFLNTMPLSEGGTLSCGHQAELWLTVNVCGEPNCTEHEPLQMYQLELHFFNPNRHGPDMDLYSATILLTDLLLVSLEDAHKEDCGCPYCSAVRQMYPDFAKGVDVFLEKRSLKCPLCQPEQGLERAAT